MVFIFTFLLGLCFWFFDFFYLLCFMFVVFVSFCLGGSVFSGLFMLDSVSFFLIFLSILVFLFCVFSSLSDFWGSNYFGSFLFLLGSVFFLLLISFSCLSYLFFYISFEFIFVVMFIFLLGWGYSPERLQASFYMVFYTIVVSFPFLVYLTLTFSGLAKFHLWSSFSGYWWLAFFVVFLVKLPVYGAHLWLPKAHVEAPVSGSMVLAGVLLKLGGYGVIRFSAGSLSPLLGKGVFVSLGLAGGLASCFLCLRQSDMKAFVAYSSVCHMGFGLAGLMSGSSFGFSGGLFMLVGHGFCSSCLFYILFVFYERFHSRSLLVLKGVSYFLPMLSFFWFLFCILNMGVPPSFPFFSEVFILSGLSSLNMFSMVFSGFVLLFSGFYGIFLYSIFGHGLGSFAGMGLFLSVREVLNFYGHLFYLLFFVMSLIYFI